MSYYLVESLDATSAQVNTYSALTYLPWCLKIFFGILSDTQPVFGLHRRPYFVGGWFVFVLSNVVLWALNTPGVANILIWSFIMTMGVLLADTVAGESLCKKRMNATFSPHLTTQPIASSRGALQARTRATPSVRSSARTRTRTPTRTSRCHDCRVLRV